jgi:hypothetical protein
MDEFVEELSTTGCSDLATPAWLYAVIPSTV